MLFQRLGYFHGLSLYHRLLVNVVVSIFELVLVSIVRIRGER
jgi:hypothetical protein